MRRPTFREALQVWKANEEVIVAGKTVPVMRYCGRTWQEHEWKALRAKAKKFAASQMRAFR